MNGNSIFYILIFIPSFIIFLYYIMLIPGISNRLIGYKIRNISFLVYWLFVLFMPTFIILLIRFSSRVSNNPLDLFLLLFFFLLPAFHFVYILKREIGKKTEVASYKIKILNSQDYSSHMLMEFVVIMILPFITLGSGREDILIGILIIILLIIVLVKLKLFTFNLPLMLFFTILKVRVSGREWYLITDYDVLEEDEVKLIKLIPTLNIALSLKRFI